MRIENGSLEPRKGTRERHAASVRDVLKFFTGDANSVPRKPKKGASDSIRYRPDIDGLRAIAVSAVVLFHAGLPGFGGGFIGVDVFFVISGYLITSLILAEIDTGSFSVVGFYQRRILRIFPALIMVVAFCVIVGYILMTPNDYFRLGKSVNATAFFVSNIFFWRQVSYFGAQASENPLLHTWSLSIEEQFYLLYPMFIVLASKAGRNVRLAAISLVCLMSFVSCVCLIYYKPSATFFLGPTRVWELLVGGILALKLIPNSNYSQRVQLLIGLAGLLCITYATFSYSSSMRYPGFAAIVPVAGAALLVWSGQTRITSVHRLLSTTPFVSLGQASYSLYLWHFPLLAYLEYLTLGRPTVSMTALACALSVGMAFVSLRFIEHPFRFPRRKGVAPRLAMVSVVCMAALILAGSYIQFDEGIASRVDPVSIKYLDAELDKFRHHVECMSLEDVIVKPGEACKLGAPAAVPSVLLWGDSHSMVTATALEHAALKSNAAILFAASVDCPIGIGFSIDAKIGPSFVTSPGYQYCQQYNKEMLRIAAENSNIKSVVLSSRWTNWHIGESGSPSEGKVDIRLRDDFGVSSSLEENRTVFYRGFDRLIRALVSAKKSIWIVGPVPEVSVKVPHALYITHIGFAKSNIDVPTESFLKRNSTILSIFSDMAHKYPIRFIWPHSVLCNDILCRVSAGVNARYLDDNHLSIFGALETAPLYEQIFRPVQDAPSTPEVDPDFGTRGIIEKPAALLNGADHDPSSTLRAGSREISH